MNDPVSRPEHPTTFPGNPVLFESEGSHSHMPGGNRRGEDTERNWLPWIVAVVVIVVIAGVAFFFGGHRGAPAGSAASGVDPYATQLVVSNVQISQATNFAGDQLTYVDGTIANHGDRTVTAITVRVLFANDEGEPPQSERVPLNLIRTRQPYVDTEPVSAAPLKPGDSQDFRLIFDDVSPMWNQQIPAVKIQNVATQR